uniref:Uncharacterized protein n=1 Tax=Anguilla anguilla TaxID=7936 RepID=A0A0E9SHK0_ANGAN
MEWNAILAPLALLSFVLGDSRRSHKRLSSEAVQITSCLHS